MKHFGISRQAMNRHIRNMVAEKSIIREGGATRCLYKLVPQSEWRRTYVLEPKLSESDIWTRDIRSRLGVLPENAAGIWQWGFTEMMNNAIDHSEGAEVLVVIQRTAATVKIALHDNGVGIFKKIKAHLGLIDERHAVLELAKGKFTTDPENHSGIGIFFTSRMFDEFEIMSGDVFFSHEDKRESDYILEDMNLSGGTSVFMTLNNHTARTTRKVFLKYQDKDLEFTKTVVPVRLAKYGDDNLVSRSQARRLLARVEKFKTVVLDFAGVDSIGQAFADEVFRVFPSQHKNVDLMEMHTNSDVKRMIAFARSGSGPDQLDLPLKSG